MSGVQSDGLAVSLEHDGFYDIDGRLAFFRGVNISSNAKFPPFIPFHDPRWWDVLASWGFNCVRLTLFWEAIEPKPDGYDQSYLDQVREMVVQAKERGIYVILDMHQDLYSRWLKGDGAPDWTFPADVEPEDNDGFGGQLWGTAYTLSGDVRACFTHFFTSRHLREHYQRAWVEVARRMEGLHNVLGYDVMNEPSCGNIGNLDGRFENAYLKPLYQEVMKEIRKVHPRATGFVEPHLLDMYTSRHTRFDLDGLVYAPHLYNPVSVTLRLNPLPEDLLFGALLEAHKMKARELGMPLFVGEFGAPWTMQPFYARNMAVNGALELMERGFINNAYWDFSVANVDGWNEEDFSLIDQKGRPRGLEVNVRPYIRRLSGLPVDQQFNSTSKTYTARFRGNPGAAPTSIYVPAPVHYQKGFAVSVSDGRTEFLQERNELLYYPAREGSHTLKITPTS